MLSGRESTNGRPGFKAAPPLQRPRLPRVDPKGPRTVAIGVPSKPYGLHARADGVWVACYGDQSVVRIDPKAGRVIGKPIPVGLNPVGVEVSHGSVWVTSVGDSRLTRIDL